MNNFICNHNSNNYNNNNDNYFTLIYFGPLVYIIIIHLYDITLLSIYIYIKIIKINKILYSFSTID